MFVTVDATGEVVLAEASVFTAFHVVAAGGGDDVEGALGADGASASADHVWVSLDAVRRLAGDTVDTAWEQGFAAMVEYARSKGWLDDSGLMIRAHIEAAT